MRLPTVALFALLPSVLATPPTVAITTTKAQPCTRPTRSGDTIHVHYRGRLVDGTQFDTSYGAGKKPFAFTLGLGQVIKGWDRGLLDMCPGEARRLTIPPELGYGDFGTGPIPPKATLVFDTELISIDGVEVEMVIATAPPVPVPTPGDFTAVKPAKEGGKEDKGHEDGPKHGNNECKLLGPFALLVQGALGALALLSLVWKRYRETPRRPLKVWSFDVSKQVVGSMLLHLANLFMSMLSSGDLDINRAKDAVQGVKMEDGRQPNPCSFYLLNLGIDTTIGIAILVVLLRVLHALFARTALANPPESLKSGNYGNPPKASWWLKQSFIYFLGLFGMKLCVLFLFQVLPWLGWVGDWALRWTEGKQWMQIVFVMFVFPLVMNAMQYWIIDSFIKDKTGGEYVVAPGEESGDEGEGLMGEEDEEEEEVEERVAVKPTRKEANPTPLPIGAEGSGASRLSDEDSDDEGKV
ncbi:hypothetical protein EJ06DRAFT_528304 [Trichodelitschia bisporula]|uniref:peptidylprolyl isomerase n=1 Tax=Trichodelitschia bisporula TaxID=703511 RepID=A0A6G1I2H1_9PEZI|nr:hypothetical protein EJ06DRAFT_528304 [Trichodelitschia bisporula]